MIRIFFQYIEKYFDHNTNDMILNILDNIFQANFFKMYFREEENYISAFNVASNITVYDVHTKNYENKNIYNNILNCIKTLKTPFSNKPQIANYIMNSNNHDIIKDNNQIKTIIEFLIQFIMSLYDNKYPVIQQEHNILVEQTA